MTDKPDRPERRYIAAMVPAIWVLAGVLLVSDVIDVLGGRDGSIDSNTVLLFVFAVYIIKAIGWAADDVRRALREAVR